MVPWTQLAAETRAPTRLALHRDPGPDRLARWIAVLGPEPDACLVCSASAPLQLFFRDGKWFWICRECELVWVHDIYPEFIQAIEYLDDRERYRPREKPNQREQREFAGLLSAFERRRDLGTLLEVGTGPGLFLAAAASAGWRAIGVEILPELAAMVREERGLDVRTGDLFDAAFAQSSFDVAYLNEVIEHIVDPVALLGEVRRVLRPGGIAVLRTGNARSWSARLRGAHWPYLHFGGHDHIRYWSPRAMAALARATGMELDSARTHGFAFCERDELRDAWYRPLVKLSQACVSPLAGPFGAGHRLTVTLRRPREIT